MRAGRWHRAAPRRAGRTGSRSTRRGLHGVERLVRVEVDRAVQELSAPELPDVRDVELERLARLAFAEYPRDQDHALVSDLGDALDLRVPAVTEGALDLLQVAADAGVAAVGAAGRRGGGAELDRRIGDGDQRLGIAALEGLICPLYHLDARPHASATVPVRSTVSCSAASTGPSVTQRAPREDASDSLAPCPAMTRGRVRATPVRCEAAVRKRERVVALTTTIAGASSAAVSTMLSAGVSWP